MKNIERQTTNFDQVGNMPETWWLCADDLLISSRLLFEEYSKVDQASIKTGEVVPEKARVFGVVRMLRAMALECIFKALWIKSGETLAKDGKYFKIPNTNDHDLLTLLDAIKTKFSFSTNSKERDFLKRLSLSIAGGRYPIHKSWESTMLQSLHGGGIGSPYYWVFPTDEKTFSSLITKLIKLLEN